MRVLTVFACAWLCFPAAAQKKADVKKSAAPPMAAPKPAPEMKELTALVGTWSSNEKFESTPFFPSGGTGTGTNTVRLGPGGFSVIMDQRSKGALGTYVGHGVMTWDPNDKVYRTVWSDSMTPGVMITTGRKEGDKVVYTGEAMMMGKKMAFKDVISDRTPSAYVLTSYMNDGSGEKKTMTIQFTRQEPAGRK